MVIVILLCLAAWGTAVAGVLGLCRAAARGDAAEEERLRLRRAGLYAAGVAALPVRRERASA